MEAVDDTALLPLAIPFQASPVQASFQDAAYTSSLLDFRRNK